MPLRTVLHQDMIRAKEGPDRKRYTMKEAWPSGSQQDKGPRVAKSSAKVMHYCHRAGGSTPFQITSFFMDYWYVKEYTGEYAGEHSCCLLSEYCSRLPSSNSD